MVRAQKINHRGVTSEKRTQLLTNFEVTRIKRALMDAISSINVFVCTVRIDRALPSRRGFYAKFESYE